mgnify:CR=1 FL=1
MHVDFLLATQLGSRRAATRSSGALPESPLAERDENRARLEAEMERPREFSIGHSLRMEWTTSQAKDPECLDILRTLDRRKEQKTGAPDRGLAPKAVEDSGGPVTAYSKEKSGRRT